MVRAASVARRRIGGTQDARRCDRPDTVEAGQRRTIDGWRHLAWTAVWASGLGLLIARIVLRVAVGGFPPHDTIAYVFAGSHLIHGEPVYANALGGFLAFWYSPAWAVLWAPLSLLSPYLVSVTLFAAQVLALHYVAGSWRVAFALGWLPFVRDELITGNVDLLMAATILASLPEVRGIGLAVALFVFAKFSPVLLLLGCSWRQRREAAVAGFVLLAVTLPVAFLWPEWTGALEQAATGGVGVWIPLAWRLPLVAALLALRRPWATAAATALAVPASYEHSLVLLLPGARLAIEALWPAPVISGLVRPSSLDGSSALAGDSTL